MQEDKEKEMTKDVVVSLKGLQLAPDQQSDAVEVIAPGEYYIRNNKHYVLFEEIMEGETQTLKNMLKFNDNYLEFTRKGDRKSTRLNSSHRSQSRMPSSA